MEHYSSHHSESVEELMDWPWQRFEAMYEAFQKRSAVEELKARKAGMMNAIYANGNVEEKARTEFVRNLESHFEEAVDSIYGTSQETEMDKENPFFAAMERGLPPLEEQSLDVQQRVEEPWEVDQVG